jgi:hypothetical protein
LVVCNRETLSAKWEEVADGWAVLLMPPTLRNTAFFLDDCEKLAPERIARNGRYMAKLGDVIWVNIGHVEEEVGGYRCDVNHQEDLKKFILRSLGNEEYSYCASSNKVENIKLKAHNL